MFFLIATARTLIMSWRFVPQVFRPRYACTDIQSVPYCVQHKRHCCLVSVLLYRVTVNDTFIFWFQPPVSELVDHGMGIKEGGGGAYAAPRRPQHWRTFKQ